MSAPGSAQPPTVANRGRRPLITAAIAGGLALIGAIVHFLPWRTFESSFVYGVTLRDIAVENRMSGVSFTQAVDATGITGTEDIGSYTTMNPALLIGFIVLAVAGAVFIGVQKVPRLGGALVAVAGLLLTAVAAARMSLDGVTMLRADDIDVTDVPTLYNRALEHGSLSTGAGAYVAVVVGVLMIAFGIYAAIRPASTAAPAPAAPTPGPYQNYGSYPAYGAHPRGQQVDPHATWPGQQPMPQQPMPQQPMPPHQPHPYRGQA